MSSLSEKDRVSLCSFTFSDRRRCPRRCKTQNRPHRRLHGANSPANHSPLQTRIHQRLRLRRLAPIRPQLRQLQSRLPLPALPRIPAPRVFRPGYHDCRELAGQPATNASPTTRPSPAIASACRNPRELSFRAQRGICFFLRLATRHSSIATSPNPRHPIHSTTILSARQPTKRQAIHSATRPKPGRPLVELRRHPQHPARQPSPLDATLTRLPQVLILNHLQ